MKEINSNIEKAVQVEPIKPLKESIDAFKDLFKEDGAEIKAEGKIDTPEIKKNSQDIYKGIIGDDVIALGENDTVNEAEVDKYKGCPIDGVNGHWSGERGNSYWIPDDDYVPIGQHTNPEGKTWGELKKEYGFDSIPFKDGEPDFSGVSKATVTIDNFSDKRYGKGGNFDQADQKLMEQTGMSKEELAKFKENYTWHEKSDCKTLELVPTVVHGNVRHNGGVTQYKSEN